jgi:hypothetical protein
MDLDNIDVRGLSDEDLLNMRDETADNIDVLSRDPSAEQGSDGNWIYGTVDDQYALQERLDEEILDRDMTILIMTREETNALAFLLGEFRDSMQEQHHGEPENIAEIAALISSVEIRLTALAEPSDITEGAS